MSLVGITKERLDEARLVVDKSPLVVRTPLLRNAGEQFGLDEFYEVHLKLENLQKTGSFKTQGLANQLAHLPSKVLKEKQKLVAMSAGNYGKAFAFAAKQLGLPATVVMPDNAPVNRVKVIQSYDATVERVSVSELKQTIDNHIEKDGMHFLHSFDDTDVICGTASVGFEILEEIPDPDIVLVGCGGGGLLAGVATAMKLSGKKTKVFGVEPEGAPKMFQSKLAGEAVTLKSVNTIASGLAPPMAGKKPFEVVKEFVEDILLVSDDEIKKAMKVLYEGGLVVEPSGAAAFAALLSKKVPNITKGSQIVVFLTGSNVTIEELNEYIG